jgi:hypothetical protein
MWPIRLTLARALGLTALLAVGLAALVVATPTWARLAATLTVATLAVAALGGLFARGRARAFWAGLAVAGWAYFAAPGSVRDELLTSDWTRQLGATLHPLHAQANAPGSDGSYLTTFDPKTRTYYVDLGGKAARCDRIAQDLLAIGLGLAGGLVALHFASRPHRPGLH